MITTSEAALYCLVRTSYMGGYIDWQNAKRYLLKLGFASRSAELLKEVWDAERREKVKDK